MDLNKAMLIGNLTRDPEMRTTNNGTNVASFAIATNLVWKDQQGQMQKKAEFHNIVAWRKLADICNQYLKKGGKVYIEGRIQNREWVGQDNQKKYRTEIVADNMIMLSSQGGAYQNQNQGGGNYQNQNQETPVIDVDEDSGEQNGASGADEEEIKVENIPF